jgi:hypothetical protein
MDSGSILFAGHVTALSEDASSHNYSLNNDNGAEAALRGGTFTARGGTEARGVYNAGGSSLFAANVTTLGETGSSYSMGLANFGVAVLRGGSFTGRDGNNTRGIYNSNPGVTMEADRVTAIGMNGAGSNYGLHNNVNAETAANSSQFIGSSNGLYLQSGTVYLGVSQLDGGATLDSGTLTCYGVYDENYTPYTCP